MMGKTKIEWCDYSINPLRVKGGKVWKHGYHCEKSSPGCVRCYAEALNMRYGTGLPYTKRDVDFYLDLSVFDTLPKRMPKRVFVQDMSDLFLPGVPPDMVWGVINKCLSKPQHTFLFLTKHPKVMYRYRYDNPLNNFHLGVTVCNQKEADEKIPILLQIPAAKRFVSIEPMLGHITIPLSVHEMLDQVYIGCESGPKRRPCELSWMIHMVNQSKEAGAPCFVKQVSINGRVSHNPDEWPASLRVREIGE